MSIIFEDVTYIYNKDTPMGKTAIRGVSLSIGGGEFVGVFGTAGSGKTTFLHLLGGLLKPVYGRVAVKSHVGVVFQFPERQFFEETVYGDLSFSLRRAGLTEGEIEERVRSALGAVDMDFDLYRDRSPLELSGGEKRRAAVAAILVLEPEVIALDEPLAGLDQRGKREMLRGLKRLQKETGKTIVLATREWETITEVCDRVLLLENGGLSGDGGTDLINRLSRLSPVPSLLKSLKEKGLDLGEGVLDAEEAFLRIRRIAPLC